MANPAPFTIRFQGTTALILGEATSASGKFRVLIDGQPSVYSDDKGANEAGIFNASTGSSGHGPLIRVVAQGLDAGKVHALTIEPLLEPEQELRLESLCVAGAPAQISL
jgi:hypothetical protein